MTRSLFPMISLVLALLALAPRARAFNDVWRSFLPDNQEMMDMMTAFQMNEYANRHSRSLAFQNTDAVATLGERCGRRTSCSQDVNLQCTPAILGSRCLPKTCVEEGLERFHANHDMQEYKELILQQAGIAEGDLQLGLQEAAQESGGDQNRFFGANIFQALKQAMDNNRAPADAFFEIYDNCTASSTSSAANGTNPAQNLDRVNYVGVHFEGNAFLEGELSFFWEQSTGQGFVRYCIGLGGIAGAQVSFLYLIAQRTLDIDAIAETCHVRGQVSFGLPVNFAVGISNGLSNNIWFMEMAAGAGLSFHAGVGFCGVSRL